MLITTYEQEIKKLKKDLDKVARQFDNAQKMALWSKQNGDIEMAEHYQNRMEEYYERESQLQNELKILIAIRDRLQLAEDSGMV